MVMTTRRVAIRALPASEPRYTRVYVWQWGLRSFHWVAAAAITALFATGLMIAQPTLTATGEPYDVFVMARVRQIHFAAGYVFAIAFVWRIYWFFAGNKYARSGFPYVWRADWWRKLVHQAWGYVKLDFGRPHLGHNALAGLSYVLFVGVLGLGEIVTGFALFSESSPGGAWDKLFGWVIPLLGGAFRTHMWHHLFAWGFLVFAILHIYIVLLDSRQYRNGLITAMITGFKFKQVDDDESER